MKKVILYFIFFLSIPSNVLGADTLDLKSFLEVVNLNHPIIKKAELFDEIKAAYDLKGKGVLDPKLYSSYDAKDFKDIDYFTVWQTEAKIPTTLPVDFSIGYEQNDGLFLNPENSVPSNGLIYGTLNVSLLRGLLFDEQRHQIQQADLDGAKNQIEKEILIREVMYQAIGAYIEWAKASNQYAIYDNYYSLVNIRHRNVVQLFLNGDKPAIDTIESKLNLNSAQKDRLTSIDYLNKKRLKLNLFIWDNTGNPLSIKEELYPTRMNDLISILEEYSILINPNFNNDPYVRKIENEIAALGLSNRLEQEQLKPELNLKYNTILNLGDNDIDPTFTFNDYKYGISFIYPILNRKTKGEIKLNNALIDQNNYDKINYKAKLSNSFENLMARQEIQTDLIATAQENIIMSQLLIEAEQLKFSIGESSIFLLNKRERKLLDSRLDLVKIYSKLGDLLNELYFLAIGQQQ